MTSNNTQSLDIVVLGLPISKGSYAPYTKAGKAINIDSRVTVWESQIRTTAVRALQAAGLHPYDCPVSISGEIRMPAPKIQKNIFPCTQTSKSKGGGDLDKLLRCIGDALQEVHSEYFSKRRNGVITNDCRIVHWNVSKLYATDERPAGIYITITPLTKEEDIREWQPATTTTANQLNKLSSVFTRMTTLKDF